MFITYVTIFAVYLEELSRLIFCLCNSHSNVTEKLLPISCDYRN